MGLAGQALAPALQQYGIRNQTPTQSSGGGLLGALGGAQLGAQAGQAVGNWWSGMQTPPMSTVGPYAGAYQFPQSQTPYDYTKSVFGK